VSQGIVRVPLNPQHERQLIQEAHTNPDAFRELYRHYFPRIYAYVAYRVGRAAEAEDLVADIFVKVVESLDTFEYRGAGSFAAWIFRIAHNHVGQFYRGRADLLSIDEVSDITSDDLSPDQTIIRKEQFIYLHSLLQTLSPRRQEIIRLKFFAELRNQEIAAVLGLDERTVASHLCRGIEDLAQRYEAKISRNPSHEPE
jgi:RNA polymerase sigma-70 factor (ECF subfamily)